MASREPIFIIGHFHSGNTMLSALLDRTPEVRCPIGYNYFLQYYRRIERLPSELRIRAIVKSIAGSEAPPLADAQCAELRRELQRQVADQPAPIQFTRAMEVLAEWSGKKRWGAHADTGWRRALDTTLFRTDEILSMFPGAKLVFPVRNPLDVAASVVGRGRGPANSFNGIRWARTVRIAEKRQRELPHNFLIVRYEDITQCPQETLPSVFSFLGLEWDDRYLDIPHVNRAETPGNFDSNEHGLSQTRTFYYDTVLSEAEEATVRAFVPKDLMHTYYPDLPPPRSSRSSLVWPKVVWLSMFGVAKWVGEMTVRLRHGKHPLLAPSTEDGVSAFARP